MATNCIRFLITMKLSLVLCILLITKWDTIRGFVIKVEKIVNGEPALDREFPFMVSIRSRNGHHNCGGTILNELSILTAGHCVCGYQEPLPTIQYGVNEISLEGPTVIEMDRIICHENYTVFGGDYAHNDIAIVKLKSKMVLNNASEPVKLNSNELSDLEEEGFRAVVTGWGFNTTDGDVQETLQRVDVPLISQEQCRSIYQDKIVASNICAGEMEGGIGQCSGDSGGPLLLNGAQIGIVSWSVKPCASPGNPGVFTRVSSFYDWINEHL